MTWNSILGLISIICLSLPILLLVALRLATYRSFPILLSYYVIVFGYNLFSQGYLPGNSALIHDWNLVNNLLDTPMILLFMTYFSPSAGFTKKLKWATVLFIAFELIIIMIKGLNTETITIILGPGLGLSFALSLHFFIRQTKITIMHKKAGGKAIISAALLFAYGCYALIYTMYYVFRTKNVEDTFLIYFLVVSISSLMMATGICIEKRRVRKLNELKIARRELSIIYDGVHSRGAVNFQNAFLDIDKDKWS